MLKINDIKIDNILYGNNIINKIYKGVELLYSRKINENPPIIVVNAKRASNGKLYTNDKNVTITDNDEFVSDIYKEGKLVKGNIASDLREDGTYYDRYGVWSGNGEYKIIATDKAKNKAEITFILDTVPPELISSKAIQDKPDTDPSRRTVTLVFNEEIDYSLIQGLNPVIDEVNTYSYSKIYYGDKNVNLMVTDIAGNKATINFSTAL